LIVEIADSGVGCRRRSSGSAGPAIPGGQQAGLGLQDHPVLVGLGEDGRDDPLAEGAVEGVVDVRRGDRQPRGGVAVDVDIGRRPVAPASL
jgi:hypothetical protein